LLHHAIDLFVIADVAQQWQQFNAEFLAVVGDLIQLRLLFSREENQISTLASKGECDGLAVVAAGTPYECGLTL
jgi:hypothetical protein